MWWSVHSRGALAALAIVLLFLVPAMPVQAAEPLDTTPPFTDQNYHEYLLYNPDTANLDILIIPPVTMAPTRDVEIIEQSIRYWDEGIKALGQDWFRDGFKMNWYKVGYEPVPGDALDDPEIVVITATYNPVRFGLLGIGLEQPVTWCHGVNVFSQDIRQLPSFHQHNGSQWATFRAQCDNGGYTCYVINMEQAGNSAGQRRNQFDLNSHEFGHCLGIGHVGDALDFTATRFPSKDIMSYQVGSQVHCVSSLNLRSLEHTYAHLLGKAPNRNTAGGFIHMDPADYEQVPCAEPTTPWLHTDPVMNADPLGLNSADSDGDGVTDNRDVCEGHDDNLDADGDGTPDGCDADNTDGPLGDSDGDGVLNRDDRCPGIDDASAACDRGDTFYFTRAATPDGSVGNVGRANGAGVMPMAKDKPTWTDPAVVYASGLDGTAPHNPIYDAAEWATPVTVALDGADVTVTWWSVQPATGAPFSEEWDVHLYFDGAATPAYSKLKTVFAGATSGLEPTEYAVTFEGVTGTGLLSVLIDPSSYTNQQDFVILYDGADYPSGITIEQATLDSDGDGVLDENDAFPFDPTEWADTDGDGVGDNSDACEGFDDAADLDGDGIPDGCDDDRDGDGVANDADAFPDDASESADSDGDGVGDNADLCEGSDDNADMDVDGIPDGCDDDRDGDGVANSDDAFPDDASESADSDGDGVGDNADVCPGHDDALDWDGDGIPDGCDDPEPRVVIGSPADGATVDDAFTVTGTTPGTAAATTQSVRIPDVFAHRDLSMYGVVVEEWMKQVRDDLQGIPGYQGLMPIVADGERTLHVFVEGGLPNALRPEVPAGWTLQVHVGIDVAPLSLTVERNAAYAPTLPRGGAVNQGLGPGTPIYMQFDGVRSSVSICTANYLWKDHAGKVWLGAAGHCFLPSGVTNNNGAFDYSRVEVFACRSDCVFGGLTGAQVFFEWQAGMPFVDFVKLGEVGYARQNGVGQDFGFVEIPASMMGDLEPEMPGFGGPYNVSPNGYIGDVYMHHGNGVWTGEHAGSKSRIGLGDGDGGDKTSWTMIGSANGGDSGSAVNALSPWSENGGIPAGTNNPRARGILTHGYADPVVGLFPTIPLVFGTTVAQAQAMANEGGFCVVPIFANEDPASSPAAPEADACRSAAVPAMVTNVVAAGGDQSVGLSWDVPADGGSPITGYTVSYGAGQTDQSLQVSENTATVTGLDNGVVYTFTVEATNAVGNGPASAPVTATPARPIRFTLEVSLDGADWQAADVYDEGNEAWQHAVPDLPDGTYTFAARLMDAGFERHNAVISIIVSHDADGDGVPNSEDVCEGHDDHADLDGDGTPDGCDDQDNRDSDADGVENWADTCEGHDDAADLDNDGTPDGCDGDRDGDGVANDADAFPDNGAEWADSDADGVGDNADQCAGFDDARDYDADGIPDGCDADFDDVDGDGIHKDVDNCKEVYNPGQEDLDGDGRGDVCDSDRDGDGHSNDREVEHGTDPDDRNSYPGKVKA